MRRGLGRIPLGNKAVLDGSPVNHAVEAFAGRVAPLKQNCVELITPRDRVTVLAVSWSFSVGCKDGIMPSNSLSDKGPEKK